MNKQKKLSSLSERSIQRCAAALGHEGPATLDLMVMITCPDILQQRALQLLQLSPRLLAT